MARPFRFGVNMVTPAGGTEWRRRCRRAEDLGYDVLLVADHLGMPAPFPAVLAAAAATRRPRVGTFVLNAAFWTPALLAREIATTDALTDGRLEVGLGTGYVRSEHEQAEVEWRSPGGRVDHLRRTVEELERLLADEEHLPRPAQHPGPPLLLGGNGDRMLRLTAEHADIAAFTGARTGAGAADGALELLTADQLEERVAVYHRMATGRRTPAELNLHIQSVIVTDDRRAAVRDKVPAFPYLTEDQVLGLPVFLIGTVGQMADQLREQRERYGFSYITVLDPCMEAFGPVIEELAGS
ncbi:TIGR03621 family F420-dependent LLM class oxidoreductase [Streptomyces sp. NPDC090053]|uniref:TIGR03621 family F420-dependent LLM class oxidoreductase n=1 Tax=Streptomyces sp. NPDC090053 TaxID=3365932 RepID=UPI00381D2546